MSTLLFKLILGPLLIGAATLVSRRWGPSVGGWLVGLPLTSAPVVLFLALDQGTPFAAAAAQAIMVGLVGVALFCLTYGWLARTRRWGWLPSMLAGWLAVLVAVAALDQVSLPLPIEFVGVVIVLGVVLGLIPRLRGAQPLAATPSWEIPARMVVVTVFILALTGLAQALGPRLSGLLAPFPLFATILAVFTHHFQGAGAANNFLRGVVLGSFSPALFFLAVAVLVQPLGIPLTFLCATMLALGLHAISLALLQRGRSERESSDGEGRRTKDEGRPSAESHA
jgi:hypothetical protein